MIDGFISTFNFEDDCTYINLALQRFKKRILENATPLTWKQPDWVVQIENALECYNLTTEEEEDPCYIDIEKLEGYHEVTRPEPKIQYITNP